MAVLLRGLEGCLRPWMRVISSSGDDETQAKRKKILSVVYFFSLALVVVFSRSIASFNNIYIPVSAGICFATAASGLVFLIVAKRAPDELVSTTTYGLLAAIIVADFVTAHQKTFRFWPMSILLLDTLLLCHMGRSTAGRVLVVLTVWLLVDAVEAAFRVGLYDLPGSVPKDDLRQLLVCDTPPCRVGVFNSFGYFFMATFVFFLDFYLTRGFAEKVFVENRKMLAAISMANTIALSLAAFDLTEAEHNLGKVGDDFPNEMRDALHDILKNLRMYRPYLPDALFDSLHRKSHESIPRRAPPGMDCGTVAIAFTDIKGSTAIWEECPEGMKKALRIHNSVMRDCIDRCEGYEVKTIGDAFMVAFQSALDACRFGLSVQVGLASSQWPQDILELPQCCAVVDDLDWDETGHMWGLLVRVGVHCGPVTHEVNAITGRCDYFGQTVNKAARIEGTCIEGAVAVSEEVLCEVKVMDFPPTDILCNTVVIPLGAVALKGVSSESQLSILLPNSLRGRAAYVRQSLRQRVQSDEKEEDCDCNESVESLLVRSVLSAPATRTLAIPSATVAHIEISLSDVNDARLSTAIGDELARVVMCLERCNGSIVAVVGAAVTAGWNTSTRCLSHFENAVHALRLLRMGSHRHHIGLSSGAVESGSIGTAEQQFLTVVGAPVHLSALLAMAAEEAATTAVYAAVGDVGRHTSLLRPIFRGRLGRGVLTLFEVNIDVPNTWCWSAEYWHAFESCDFTRILSRAREDGDRVLQRVLLTMLAGKALVQLGAPEDDLPQDMTCAAPHSPNWK
eukprot:Sspe_Gene.119674::Locus_116289_Transcript_1_1_Confidence_1.000_Length_2561::g.119674::m.119674